MAVRHRLAQVDLATARTALTVAERARTFTAEDRLALDADVKQRVSEHLAAGRRFNSDDLRREAVTAMNRRKIEEAKQAAAIAHGTIRTVRQTLDQVKATARQPAPLPPVLSDEERKHFITSDAARQVELRTLNRTLRRLEFLGEYGAAPLTEQVSALEAADAAQDLELLHWLEPRLERALRAAVPPAKPGDLEGYQNAKREHDALVTRFEGVREARLTDDDRAALTDAEAQVVAIEKQWHRPGGEGDLQAAVQHVGRVVPMDAVAAVG
jgi:hypothetical protein